MLKILSIVGARPQFIKAAAISRKIKAEFKNFISEILVHTGQHYDPTMSDIFFKEMNIPIPQYNLGVGSGDHGTQTAQMMEGLEKLMLSQKPDGIIVYGDTNSTLAGSLVGSKLHIPIIHIEAGLRSFNKKMPEEINRIVTDHVSTLLFAPTPTGVQNLKNEGLVGDPDKTFTMDNPGIFHSGDIMYDNTLFFSQKADELETVLKKYNIDCDQYLLITLHRPVNTDFHNRLENILEAFLSITDSLDIDLIIPLHPRSSTQLENLQNKVLLEKLNREKHIHIIPPVSFLEMISLEKHSKLIITDSGGVQKEAWFFQKPVVVLRAETEWIEIIENGNGKLVDASPIKIISAVEDYIQDPPSRFPTIFGNGDAAGTILKSVLNVDWR